MKQVTHDALCRRCALGACLALAACTTTPPTAIESPAPVAAKTWPHLAQRGHGAQAVFVLCRGDACPQTTPKTLGAVSRPIAPAAPIPAASAPIPVLESIGPGEHMEAQTEPAEPSAEEQPDMARPTAPQ